MNGPVDWCKQEPTTDLFEQFQRVKDYLGYGAPDEPAERTSYFSDSDKEFSDDGGGAFSDRDEEPDFDEPDYDEPDDDEPQEVSTQPDEDGIIFSDRTAPNLEATINLPLHIIEADDPQYRDDVRRGADYPFRYEDGHIIDITLTFPLNEVILGGPVRIPSIGIDTVSCTAGKEPLDSGFGLMVLDVHEKSIAEQCGLMQGDIILHINKTLIPPMPTKDAATLLAQSLMPTTNHQLLGKIKLTVCRQPTYSFS